MFGVSILDDLVQKVIIRLRVSASFSGSCSLLFCPFLCTILFVLWFYYIFCVCGLCPEGWRILVPLVPCACPLGAHFGPEVCFLIPLMGTWFLWPEPALYIEGASPSLCGCHGPVCGGSAPWLVEQSLQICFFSVILICGVGRWNWSTPPGEKPLRIAALGMFPLGCALCIFFTHWVSLMWPWLALILVPPQPWVWRHMALGSLRCCFPQVTSIDPLNSGPRSQVLWCCEGSSDSGLSTSPSVWAHKVYSC